MTIFQFWESCSIGHLSPIFTKDDLIMFTIAGCIATLIQTIVACSANFSNHPNYDYKDYAPSKVIGTMYAPLYILLVTFISSIEFIIMIQMSFAKWAIVLYCVFLIVLFIMKIVKAKENEKSLFGLIGWIQTLTSEYIIKLGRTFFFQEWFERMYILNQINRSQDKYLKHGGSR